MTIVFIKQECVNDDAQQCLSSEFDSRGLVWLSCTFPPQEMFDLYFVSCLFKLAFKLSFWRFWTCFCDSVSLCIRGWLMSKFRIFPSLLMN